MNRFVTILTIIGGSVLMAQCTAKKATSSSMTPDQKVAEVKKNFTDEQMEEGRVVFEASCQKCHKLYEPGSRDVEKWERVLPRMNKRANLDDSQAGKVRAYLLAHAKI